MRSADARREYLSEATLIDLGTISTPGRGPDRRRRRRVVGLPEAARPLWHQVGRVCFHLGENRQNEEYPFAFMATYAPSVVSGSRIRYQPLSRAMLEFAGKNKPALVRLLSPVQTASQKSAW